MNNYEDDDDTRFNMDYQIKFAKGKNTADQEKSMTITKNLNFDTMFSFNHDESSFFGDGYLNKISGVAPNISSKVH